MKQTLMILALVFSVSLYAQQKPTDLDKSPMDMSYFPTNYPVAKISSKVQAQPIARLIYSRPQKNNRIIFDGIVKYGEMWRLGANEATEIELMKNARINNKSISKGKYTLYCIPTANKWTLIVSKDNYCWGNYSYNPKNDVVRADIATEKTTEIAEAFTAYFEETKTGANLVFMWDDVKATLPINF